MQQYPLVVCASVYVTILDEMQSWAHGCSCGRQQIKHSSTTPASRLQRVSVDANLAVCQGQCKEVHSWAPSSNEYLGLEREVLQQAEVAVCQGSCNGRSWGRNIGHRLQIKMVSLCWSQAPTCAL